MTTDERLDRLTERTQAIAESLELVVLEVRELSGNVKELGKYIQQDAENIRRLAHIAEIHQQRITHLEGGEPA
jgi:peptidoglycan hydrolase CwlO-like protein